VAWGDRADSAPDDAPASADVPVRPAGAEALRPAVATDPDALLAEPPAAAGRPDAAPASPVGEPSAAAASDVPREAPIAAPLDDTARRAADGEPALAPAGDAVAPLADAPPVADVVGDIAPAAHADGADDDSVAVGEPFRPAQDSGAEPVDDEPPHLLRWPEAPAAATAPAAPEYAEVASPTAAFDAAPPIGTDDPVEPAWPAATDPLRSHDVSTALEPTLAAWETAGPLPVELPLSASPPIPSFPSLPALDGADPLAARAGTLAADTIARWGPPTEPLPPSAPSLAPTESVRGTSASPPRLAAELAPSLGRDVSWPRAAEPAGAADAAAAVSAGPAMPFPVTPPATAPATAWRSFDTPGVPAFGAPAADSPTWPGLPIGWSQPSAGAPRLVDLVLAPPLRPSFPLPGPARPAQPAADDAPVDDPELAALFVEMVGPGAGADQATDTTGASRRPLPIWAAPEALAAAGDGARPVPELVFAVASAAAQLPGRPVEVARRDTTELASTTTMATSSETPSSQNVENGPAMPDPRVLAEQVYALIKRRLQVESERAGGLPGRRRW
jgi:hypothetical protein